ncbi:MAG: alpha/beta hydrolase [Dehalococcoidia bacterium]
MDGTTFEVQHHYASINGIRMHYVEAGQGDLVLLLHGFPESWFSWRHQIAALSPHYRVVAPDLRGYNETEDRPPYDTATLQQDVLALIDHVGERSAHIVAHDWGGAIGWLLAIHHPEAVRSLAALNIPHPARFFEGVRRPRQLLRSWYIFFFQVPWLPERLLARDDYRWLARMIIRQCRKGTFSRDDVRTMLEIWRRQGLAGGINWYRALFRDRQPLPDPIPVIQAPVTIIWGEKDTALGKELTAGTGRLVRDLTIHYLPGISHWVQQEAPGDVNRLLLQHLQNASRRASS